MLDPGSRAEPCTRTLLSYCVAADEGRRGSRRMLGLAVRNSACVGAVQPDQQRRVLWAHFDTGVSRERG